MATIQFDVTDSDREVLAAVIDQGISVHLVAGALKGPDMAEDELTEHIHRTRVMLNLFAVLKPEKSGEVDLMLSLLCSLYPS